MTFVVTENCILCKYTDCVAVCPVECIHEGANMVLIDPDGCIDCGACEPVCPSRAIVPEDDKLAAAWIDHNREYAANWPVISKMKDPLSGADEQKERPGKAGMFVPWPA